MDRIGEPPGGAPAIIEWAVAELPHPCCDESGDAPLVAIFDGGALLAAVDGLGHGPDAALAAATALAALREDPMDDVLRLVERCHERLRGTRGVALSLASIASDARTVTWLGVGNVESILVRGDPVQHPSREWLSPGGGVVGYQLPRLRPVTLPLSRDDVLVFATDGIDQSFATRLGAREPPKVMAGRILAQYGLGTDDALVLAARYLGR